MQGRTITPRLMVLWRTSLAGADTLRHGRLGSSRQASESYPPEGFFSWAMVDTVHSAENILSHICRYGQAAGRSSALCVAYASRSLIAASRQIAAARLRSLRGK